MLSLGRFGMAGVYRLNDHPAGRVWAAAPCLGLSAATCGVIDKIKDAATTGHLILPSVVGLALVGAGSPGLALELLLPCRKLSGVCRKLIVGGNEGVQLLLRPSVPILCHTLVDSDQLPVLGAGRSDNSIPSRQGLAGLGAPDLDGRSDVLDPEQLAELRVCVDLRRRAPTLDEPGERPKRIDLDAGSGRRRQRLEEVAP